ncbi:helix-turn-helix domain-containing protein [Pseudooceanicola marinus]|uniref:helix-turn-helix domain-containing protein n=1 Tax=Pseudooceanicola marinus TaxID=396013 RepID=UPI001CD5FC61|nr:helix-turn-helix domain-containing protein [Pseudooceanicola marinus]MCA1334642.1 AraC family transcriptional regulator [Pseudooceanicola marinus]
MPAIPLPFLVSGVLVLVALRLLKRPKRDRLFLIFVGACAVQTMLVGLRWSIGLDGVRFIQPLFAACLPPLAYAAFVSLRGGAMSRLHLLWPAAVGMSWWTLPAAIDLLLIVEFTAYGIAILALRLPEEVLTQVRIGNEWAISYARTGIAALLLLSGLSDTIVAISLSKGDSGVAAPVIAAMLSVVLLGLAGGVLGWATEASPDSADVPLQVEDPGVASGTEEEQAILKQVETILSEGLYRDHDLTLERLARRTRIPARKISRAVNHLRQCSVTDLVNGYRTREAMRLLRDSDLPVTQVMLDAGFQTKSNFNRAFKAIAGQTPSSYRSSGN